MLLSASLVTMGISLNLLKISLYKMESQLGRHFNTLSLGVCVSKQCQDKTVEKLSRLLLEGTHFSTPNPEVYKLKHCTVNTTTDYTFGFKAFFGLVISLVIMATTSTVYQNINRKKSSSIVSKIVECFDVKHNWNLLFVDRPDDIRVLNGIRVITASAMIFVHVYFIGVYVDLSNGLDVDNLVTSSIGYIFMHLDLALDTFFVLSSLLFTKALLSMKRNKFYLKPIERYIRLIGPFAMVIFYMTSVSTYMFSGPYKLLSMESEQKICEKTWWKQLLMMDVDGIDMCCLFTWYIPCDYQLGIFAILLIYVFTRNKKLGFLAFGIAFLFSLIIPGFITYWYSFRVLITSTIQDIVNYRENEALNRKYLKSYNRAAPYLVGMAMGYIIYQYNPAKFRNKISKKWSVIGTSFATALLLAILATGKITLDRPYDRLEASVISAMERPLWGLGVCIIIGVGEYGSVSYIRDFLSWHVFTPLSRLSYGMYLSHVLLIHKNVLNAQNPVTFDIFAMVTDALGIYLMSILASILLWILVEAPLNNISGRFFFSKKTIDNKAT